MASNILLQQQDHGHLDPAIIGGTIGGVIGGLLLCVLIAKCWDRCSWRKRERELREAERQARVGVEEEIINVGTSYKPSRYVERMQAKALGQFQEAQIADATRLTLSSVGLARPVVNVIQGYMESDVDWDPPTYERRNAMMYALPPAIALYGGRHDVISIIEDYM